jgi:predicted RNase H-like HicB family nuclease
MVFTALLHDCRLDGETGFAATCAEVPSAVGQGETVEECLADLKECIEFIFETNRQEATASFKDEVRELQLA